jgi:putative DNA methylase
LIEVAMPLEAINRESAREKSIRHGHPSTLHLWWARRPLAACRAVLFAQLVDDPSSHPDRFPDEASQTAERMRLFDIIERLVVWENGNDEALLKEARSEIWASCDGKPPPILDPFAGGGSIPLEAQRLGLKAHASDLNPVAVLINKALIEIPPKWAGRPPVFPGASEEKAFWPGTTGLAEDVRRYGNWMREEAEKRIGHIYPKAKLTDGSEATVIAWIWARTVKCPNPGCSVTIPLARSWWLGKKRAKEAYVVPSVVGGDVTFTIGHDPAMAPTPGHDGTVSRNGVVCVACGDHVPLSYVRTEGKAGRMSVRLLAIAAEGDRQRIYLPPNQEHISVADVALPADVPDTDLPEQALGFRVQGYGMTKHRDLFTNRQLVALTTLSDLVTEARERVRTDTISAGMQPEEPADRVERYVEAVTTYLALAVSRLSSTNSALCRWNSHPSKESVSDTFARQALAMVWDYAEGNPFMQGPCDLSWSVTWVSRVLDSLVTTVGGDVAQDDAAKIDFSGCLVSTDPPYYDNVGYADLSDFFYAWLRRSLLDVYPRLFGTLLTPKADELVADPFRHGAADRAERFFEDGFVQVFDRVRKGTVADYPITIFYAYKQAESDDHGKSSTGWETFLDGLLRSGWAITGTWPIRTERGGRMRDIESNALASSVILACRPRPASAPTVDRRGLIATLRNELPKALKDLQQGSVAPVDLAQAAIGPGMAVFSRYAHVAEPDGSSMDVSTALKLINRILDEIQAELEGDLDSDSRFALKWFEEFGWDEGDNRHVEGYARRFNTSAAGLERAGIFRARAGKAWLIPTDQLPTNYNPASDERISVWEIVLHLVKRMEEQGIDAAGRFMAQARGYIDLDAAKELAYLLYMICDRRKWAHQALRFNNLVTSWLDLDHVARMEPLPVSAAQGSLLDELPVGGEE